MGRASIVACLVMSGSSKYPMGRASIAAHLLTSNFQRYPMGRVSIVPDLVASGSQKHPMKGASIVTSMQRLLTSGSRSIRWGEYPSLLIWQRPLPSSNNCPGPASTLLWKFLHKQEKTKPGNGVISRVTSWPSTTTGCTNEKSSHYNMLGRGFNPFLLSPTLRPHFLIYFCQILLQIIA